MVFAVQGLWCTSCAMALQRVLTRVPGIRSAAVNFTSGSALLTWVPEEIDFTQLLARARQLGYELAPLQDGPDDSLMRQAQRLRTQLVVAVVFGMWSMLGSWVLYLNGPQLGAAAMTVAWLSLMAGLPVVLYSGLDFYRAAWRTLRSGVAGIDALVTVGVWGSIAVSLWELATGRPDIYIDAATMLICFLLAGRLFEAHARQESHGALDALRQLAPEVATLLEADGSEREVRLSEIAPGMVVRVLANERIAVDGVVVQGHSLLDCALLSGESLPLAVGAGDAVLAGSVNQSGPLHIRVSATQGQRRIDLLGLRMVELFGARSSLSETAERFVRVLLPAVLVMALAAFCRYLWIGQPLDRAVLEALAILVAACPCAVGLAMPLAYILAAQRAAALGVLLRDPVSLEGLARASVFAFDKTGTLTSGELVVAGVQTTSDWTADAVLGLAREAESAVNHPIAHALRQLPGDLPAFGGPYGEHRSHPRGVSMVGRQGNTVRVGARDWLLECGVQGVPDSGTIHVAEDGRWLGSLLLQDSPRPDTQAALQSLQQSGARLWLVSGDSAEACERVVNELGLAFEQVHSRVTPEEKAALVAGKAQDIAFTGDGANDGLVLASSACGIAIPGASTVAVAAAGVVITEGGLKKLVEMRQIARRAMRIARQNLFFSVAYNIGIVVIFFGAGVTPFAAAIAMLLSSSSVFLNTCRINAGPHRF